MENLNKYISAITKIGGSFTGIGATKDNIGTASLSTYFWDDSGQIVEGIVLTFSTAYIFNEVIVGCSANYPCRGMAIYIDGVLKASTTSTVSTPYTFVIPGGASGKEVKIIRTNNSFDQVISQININGLSCNTKNLIEEDGFIKYINASTWNIAGNAPATLDMFTTYGYADLSLMTDALTKQLKPNFKLLTWIDNTVFAPGIRMIADPITKLILPSTDISLVSIQSINQMTVKTTVSGSGAIRLIVSIDRGVTWKIFDGSNWCPIDISSPSNVIAIGMTIAQINIITKQQWDMLGATNIIRFGYALSINASTDVANTDILSLSVDMRGMWDGAQHYVDYKTGYPNSSTINVRLLTSGDYKINY